MNEVSKVKLVAAWIAAQEAGEIDSWAITAMGDIPQLEPELGWELIVRIHAVPISEEVRDMLAASPLEDLLVYHGEQFFPRIKELALRDPVFRNMLSSIWLDEKDSPIAREFYELAGVAAPASAGKKT
ncbi:MAG: DUF6869 domain-containing protein [Burkholderiales bacterium]